MLYLILLIISVLLIGSPVAAQGPDWYAKAKELKLLYSNVQDVIRIYDLASKIDENDLGRYEWNIPLNWKTMSGGGGSGMTSITFKDRPYCPDWNRHSGPGWDVAEWTVIHIEVDLGGENALPLDELPFSVSGFEQQRIADHHEIRFTNDTEGIWVLTDLSRKVKEVHFHPPAAMNDMHCTVPKWWTGSI
jgi:hypothetical protein